MERTRPSLVTGIYMCDVAYIDQGMLNRQRGMGQCPGASPSTIGLGGALRQSYLLVYAPLPMWLILGPYRAYYGQPEARVNSITYIV
jgi:hypothetical protein